jgi:endonuclease-3
MAQANLKGAKAKDHALEVRRMGEILRILKRTYPDAECSLTHSNPFQLLISTILSAQCTDERVNRVTPALFAKYPDPHAMAKAPLRDLEKLIKTTGFFHSKAKSLQETSRALVAKHGGEVPSTLGELTALRGVGRKTANVVLGNAFDTPGLVVDTHVGRISRRLGFTRETDPVKVEHAMETFVPREDWTLYSHLLISHGRAVCTARKAMCEECPVAGFCPKIGVQG